MRFIGIRRLICGYQLHQPVSGDYSASIQKFLIIYLTGITQFPRKYPYPASQVRGDPQGAGQPFLRSAGIRLSGSSRYTPPQWLLCSPPSGVISLWPASSGPVQQKVRPPIKALPLSLDRPPIGTN